MGQIAVSEDILLSALAGWLAGEKIITEEFDYGLRDAGVDMEKQTIITIADKEAKIVGIYPGARIRNLRILCATIAISFPKMTLSAVRI